MSAVPIAFYAPLKSPDHPSPSGDRTMARLFARALREAGFAPALASGLRTYEPAGDRARQEDMLARSLAEADRLDALWAALPPGRRPTLWFTYHTYYKAPDHLGPEMARRLRIPYAVAEASRAGKRARGPWAFAHEAAERANDAADCVFVMTAADREAWERARRQGQALVDLPPFLDLADWPPRYDRPPRASSVAVRLLSVGMMRAGDKLSSYRLLAAALAEVADVPWTLDIVGEGPARPEVEAAFAPFGDRVRLLGERSQQGLAVIYAAADLLVWPAVNEAYGMVLLEAQAMGCPVLAGGHGGVASAMRPGVTGLLPAAGDAAAFAHDLRRLITDRELRRRLGEAAAAFVRTERSLAGAATILRDSLRPLLAETAPP